MTINSNGKIITMTIDDNKQAYGTMQNYLQSGENKMRSIYNYGFKDGYEIGLKCATEQIVERIVGELKREDQVR